MFNRADLITKPGRIKRKPRLFAETRFEKKGVVDDPECAVADSQDVNLFLTPDEKRQTLADSIDRMYHSSSIPSLTAASTANTDIRPEREAGSCEYKLQLLNLSNARIAHLTTQLKWRLAEGFGIAWYFLGVSDCGRLMGLADQEVEESVKVIARMCSNLGAEFEIVETCTVGGVDEQRTCLKIRVTEHHRTVSSTEARIVILGGPQTGKSTLIGCLLHGEPDNGRGKSRLHLHRHQHELRSGHTSTLTTHLIGFDPDGNAIRYSPTHPTLRHVVNSAKRTVSLMDTPGLPKYQRTTIRAFTAHQPHYAFILVSPTRGLDKFTREMIFLSEALHIPYGIVVSGVDRCSKEELANCLTGVLSFVAGKKKVEVVNEIGGVEDIASTFCDGITVPLFLSSAISLPTMVPLLGFLANLRPRSAQALRFVASATAARQSTMPGPTEFVITTHRPPILYGTVFRGSLHVGMQLFVGPLSYSSNGAPKGGGANAYSYLPVTVTSIHHHTVPVSSLSAGHHGSVCVSFPSASSMPSPLADIKLSRSSVLVATVPSESIRQFTLRILHGREEEFRGNGVAYVGVGGVCIRSLLSPADQSGSLSHQGERLETFAFRQRSVNVYVPVGAVVVVRGSKGGAVGIVVSVE
ncbi:hypothetical protein HDU85_006895 [Gaertneriomyces sp. JEL0708]|nr:hypothetical protein HDU85_006895 [Gaertneriomyces sp. JEL0708]